MNIADTSIEAFNKIVNSGVRGKRQRQVFELIWFHGPISGARVSEMMHEKYLMSKTSEGVRNRITELLGMGVVEINGSATKHGFRGRLYQVTRRVVQLSAKKETRGQAITRQAEEIAILRRRVTELDGQIAELRAKLTPPAKPGQIEFSLEAKK